MEVRAVPLQPHCFHFGGFDILMLRALELLRGQGIHAAPLDFWSRDDEFDVLFLWGLDPTHVKTARAAKANGKKIVVFGLLPYLSVEGWIRHIGGLIEGRRRAALQILSITDRLLVHSDQQIRSAVWMFGFPAEKVTVVPNIIEPYFFAPEALAPLDDLTGYIACIGNIWPRKNQVRLARAAKAASCPVLFAGAAMGGQEAYTREFVDLVDSTPMMRWHGWLPADAIRRVYANAIGVALPSFAETQPGTAFEAAAMGKPLMLGNRSYAKQKYFKGAYLADPASERSIAAGLDAIRQSPDRYTIDKRVMAECHPDQIAVTLRRAFESL